MEGNKRIAAYDGLRGIGALMIFGVHYYGTLCKGNIVNGNIPLIIWKIMKHGNLAVMLFFCLSGFLVARNYSDKICELSLVRFLANRLNKLYLPYLLCAVLGLATTYIDYYKQYEILNTGKISVYSLLVSILMMCNWVDNTDGTTMAMWFISILFLCYLIWFIIAKYSKDRNRYFLICVFVVILGWWGKLNDYRFLFFSGQCISGYVSFFVGALLYDITKMILSRGKIRMSFCYVLIMAAAVIGYCTIMEIFLDKIGGAWVEITLVHSLFVIPVLILCASFENIVSRFLSLYPLKRMGELSMYIMLSHPSLIMVIGILNALFGLGIDYGNIVTLVIVFGIEMVWAIAWMMMFRKMNLSIVRKLIIDME